METDDGMITLKTPACPLCTKTGTLTVSAIGFRKWNDGMLIQHAFPEMSTDQREQLKTGTHPKCWEEMFANQE